MQLVDIPSVDLEYVASLPSIPFQDRNLMPNLSGIYFVCISVPDVRVIYIGKTTSFCRRWLSHNKTPELELLHSLRIPVNIHLLELDWDSNNLILLENLVINKFNPPMNVAGLKDEFMDEGSIFFLPTVSDNVREEISSRITRPLDGYATSDLVSIAKSLLITVTRKRKKILVDQIKMALGEYYNEPNIITWRRRNSNNFEKVVSTQRRILPQEIEDLKRKEKERQANIAHLLSTDFKEILEQINYSDISSYRNVRIRVLKKLASALNVRGYSVMTKDELVFEIQKTLSSINSSDPGLRDPGDPMEALDGVHGSAY